MAKITKSLVVASLISSTTASADVMLGAYVPGDGFSTSAITDLNTTVPKTAAFINLFSSFSHDWDHLYWQTSNIVSEGAMPLISWMPIDLDRPDTSILGEIVEGEHDEYIDLWSTKLIAWIDQYPIEDRPKILLRFGHEFNGNWYAYGNSPFQFQSAWQYIHDRFEVSGANVYLEWVWSANNVSVDDYDDITAYYPGNNYVDWTSIDGYNFGSNYSWTSWESFTDLFSDTYLTLINEYPDKPIMIAEIGSAEEGDLPDPSMGQYGDNSDAHNSKELWIADFLTELESSFPAVRAISWFNTNKELGWSITQQGNTGISSYIAGVQSDYFTTEFLSAPDSPANVIIADLAVESIMDSNEEGTFSEPESSVIPIAEQSVEPLVELNEEVAYVEPESSVAPIAEQSVEPLVELNEEVAYIEPKTSVAPISKQSVESPVELNEEVAYVEHENSVVEIASEPVLVLSEEVKIVEVDSSVTPIAVFPTETIVTSNEESDVNERDSSVATIAALPPEPDVELYEEFSLIGDGLMCFTGTETQLIEQQAKVQSAEKILRDDEVTKSNSYASVVRAKTSYTNALSAFANAHSETENASSQYWVSAAKHVALKKQYQDQLGLNKTILEKKNNALASARELIMPLLYSKGMFANAEEKLETAAFDLESAEKETEIESMTVLFDEAEGEFYSARSALHNLSVEFQAAKDFYFQLEQDYDKAFELSQALLQRYNNAKSRYHSDRALYFKAKRQEKLNVDLWVASRSKYQETVSGLGNRSTTYFNNLGIWTDTEDRPNSMSSVAQAHSVKEQSASRISEAPQELPLAQRNSSRLLLSDPKTTKEEKDAEKLEKADEKEQRKTNKVKKIGKSEQALLAQSKKPAAVDSEKLRIRKEKYKNITEQELIELKQIKLDVLDY